MRIIGMMSGTSYDAIDAAAADVRLEGGELVLTPLGMVSTGYPDDLKTAITDALPPATTSFADVCRLDTRIGQEFAELAHRANGELCGGQADLVASHGQTVYHWVEAGAVLGTLQIGQPAWIAERTGCPVVADFRPRDVAAGGQGAPLVSIVDALWLQGRPGTAVAVNLGGIANITVAGADPVAFDTGPANALIDAAVRQQSGGAETFDRDGRRAASGRVNGALLDRFLAEPYYARRAPKTTGKELFHLDYLTQVVNQLPPIGDDDVIATLTALTARTVADAVRGAGATELIASGGGTLNPTLMAMIRAELPELTVYSSDDLGLPSAAKEAYAFAVLGFLTVHNLPATVPSCTGAGHPSLLGSVTPGRHGLPRPALPDAPPVRLAIGRP